MNTITRLWCVTAMFLLTLPTYGQDFLGLVNDNWAGVHGVFFQPASIVDMRYKVDINLVSNHFQFANNYAGLRRSYIKERAWENDLTWDEMKAQYMEERWSATDESLRDQKFVYLSNDFVLPSIAVTINEKNSLAITARSRLKFILDDLNPDLAKLSYEGLEYPDLWFTQLNNEDFSFQTMAWNEYGFTYGREIINLGSHYVKGAASLKLMQGLGSAYIFVRDLNYQFNTDDTLSLFNSQVSYGHSTNFEFDSENIRYEFISNPTIGFDMGFVYEWRPNHQDYTYDMNGETGLARRDLNKYKLKVGFSLLDIGRLKFEKGDQSANFIADIDLWDISNFDLEDVNSFNDTIASRFGFQADEGEYTMNLPSAIAIQVDYNIWKGFYANFSMYTAFKRRNDVSKVRDASVYSITPRYEHAWFALAVPLSYSAQTDLQMGMSLRAGPIIVGTNDLIGLVGSDEIYSADFYVGLKIPVPFTKPKDRDGDFVSNDRDKCKKVPGDLAFDGCPDSDADGLSDKDDLCPEEAGPAENSGCPYLDTDGDTIIDINDDCPEIPGPIENNGCPWGDIDGDSIPDNVDECPDSIGPPENNGCPWGDLDGDTVLDNVDKCVDVPGPRDNDGCPYGDRDGDGLTDDVDGCPDEAGPEENNGCPWGDLDGDGVLDNVDECPKTPGTVANNGCPELEEEEEEVINTAFENLEFESGKAVIKDVSFASLKELAKLLVDHPEWKLRVAGHTDATGSDALNLKLSQDRAEAVKVALVKEGVNGAQVIVEYYGETQPVAPNTTAEGRQKNRRVEMEVVFE